MLKFFFSKNDKILDAKIHISEKPSFEILNSTNEIGDKELILLALLIYGRFLRVEISKKERFELISFFEDYYAEFRVSNDMKEYTESINKLIGEIAKTKNSKIDKTILLRKVKNGNIYLDMGVVNVRPFSTIVYIVFKAVWEKLEYSENKVRLLEAFLTLGRIYNKESFTMKSAIDWPNIIVNDSIEFDKPLEYRINF